MSGPQPPFRGRRASSGGGDAVVTLAAMRVHAEPRALTRPLPGGREGATVTVEPLIAGNVQFAPGFFERLEGPLAGMRNMGIGVRRSRWWTVPCPVFLIHHPEVGPVVVDTGLHPSVSARPHENLGRLYARFARPRLDPGADAPAQLRARGLDSKAVPVVVLTHLHEDHASGIAEFPNSTFVVTEAEWKAATSDRRPLLRGYRLAQFDYVFDYRTLDYGGPEIASYATFGRTFDLFGDGSVRLASTPGHTLGHQSVICRLAQRDLVIAGDAIYTRRQLDGGPEPARQVDPHTWRRSLRELQRFRDRYPQAVIVPGHDPDFFATIGKRYE
jgi:N-acyl homoserine lactone hydrolase